VGAELQAGAIPVLEGVRELAAADLFPGGTRRNYQALAGLVDWDRLPETERLLLCDAQTSGGLLVALDPSRAPVFEAALAGSPYPAARVGVVSDGSLRVSP
jgi:selenide,water dikinase